VASVCSTRTFFVGARKVFYRSTATAPIRRRCRLKPDLPLRPGINIVSVVSQ
jgi:hypothetical protein